MKNNILVTLLLFLSLNCMAQTRFNKIVDLDREAHHILVSVTPNDSVYIIVCGTDNYEQPDDRRCALIAVLDSTGTCINKSIVADNTTDVYENDFDQKIVITNHGTYKYIFVKEWLGAYICEFDEYLDIINSRTIYFSNDSSLVNVKMPGFTNIDDYLYIPASTKIDTLDTEFWHPILYKIDSNNNLIYKKNLYLDNSKHQYFHIREAHDSNLIALGNINSLYNLKWLVSKIDTAGNIMWHHIYGRKVVSLKDRYCRQYYVASYIWASRMAKWIRKIHRFLSRLLLCNERHIPNMLCRLTTLSLLARRVH